MLGKGWRGIVKQLFRKTALFAYFRGRDIIPTGEFYPAGPMAMAGKGECVDFVGSVELCYKFVDRGADRADTPGNSGICG